MQTAASCTGENYTDADVVKNLGEPADFERFKAMNSPVWAEGL
jgi:hypothetical protein